MVLVEYVMVPRSERRAPAIARGVEASLFQQIPQMMTRSLHPQPRTMKLVAVTFDCSQMPEYEMQTPITQLSKMMMLVIRPLSASMHAASKRGH